MTALAGRRQELLIQSEVNRRLLSTRCEELKEAVSWLETGYGIYQKIRPFGVFVSPVVGFMASRFWRRPLGTAGKIESAMRVFQTIRQFWRGEPGGSPES